MTAPYGVPRATWDHWDVVLEYRALGFFKDSPLLCLAAAEYLAHPPLEFL
jgi:hypothetical protein